MKKIEMLGLETIPEIQKGDKLAQIVCDCAKNENIKINDKDIIVLTSKIVTKALGLTKKMSDVKVSQKALKISENTGKSPFWVQMILDTGQQVLAVLPLKGTIKKFILADSANSEMSEKLCEAEKCLIISKDQNGYLHTCDAGIDGSNHPQGIVGMVPDNPDEEALKIRKEIEKISNAKVAVILADTELTLFGSIDTPVGSSGINPYSLMFGCKDKFGKPKFGGIDLVTHEITAASALLFGQTDSGIPVAIIRGYDFEIDESRNISNTLQFGSESDILKTIRETMRLTSYAINGFYRRILLRIGSFFIR
jgi:coenzyme F420-0:L-glutamate ligase/coenzyme F420-1:gamma-L-glutamate ligase